MEIEPGAESALCTYFLTGAYCVSTLYASVTVLQRFSVMGREVPATAPGMDEGFEDEIVYPRSKRYWRRRSQDEAGRRPCA